LFAFTGKQYLEKIEDSLTRAREDDVIRRLWAGDYTLWKESPAEITNRLGWMQSPYGMPAEIPLILHLLQKVGAEGFTDALLMGMGGSSLAPDLFTRAFPRGEGGLHIKVLDSTDPAAVMALADCHDPAKTLFIVSTKSGSTSETLSFLKYFYTLTAARVNHGRTGSHFIAITDPGSSLESLARDLGFRSIFLNDPDIGGRYSALSFFGLVPAGLLGLDLRLLLDRARAAAEDCRAPLGGLDGENIGTVLGCTLGTLHNLGVDKLTLLASPGAAPLGPWLEQLLAESTGKEGKGILPVEGEDPGPPAVYGKDRVFAYLTVDGEDPFRQEVHTLEETGHPVIRIRLRDAYDIGAEFFRWEWATAVAGHLMGINPFDQPNVESAKVQTRTLLEAYRKTGSLPAMEPAFTESGIDVFTDSGARGIPEALEIFLSGAGPGSYTAVQAYLNPLPEVEKALQGFRHAVRDRYRIATTLGFGPRFLHSTGQLHKGDGGKGLFIQVTGEDREDLAIPDRPGNGDSSLTFGILKEAQASGDRQALLDAGRKVIRFHIRGEVVEGIGRLERAAEGKPE